MNPFQPGAGLLPDYMGHRLAAERPLVDIVDRLRVGEADLRLAYLYGPRGNGKTVLLQWLADHVEKKGGAHPIVQVRLLPEHLTSSEMLVQRIRSAVRRTPGVFDNLTVNLEAGIPGVSIEVGSEARDDPMLGLSDWLEQAAWLRRSNSSNVGLRLRRTESGSGAAFRDLELDPEIIPPTARNQSRSWPSWRLHAQQSILPHPLPCKSRSRRHGLPAIQDDAACQYTVRVVVAEHPACLEMTTR